MLAAIVVIGTATVSSVEAISSDEAVQSALARVPGATVANVTEFNRDYENGRLEYEGEIHYNGYEYDFEIDADTGTITKWEVEQEILNRFDSQFFVFLC
ncbi:PepSY domain-containing protein [Veillonella sp.]|uniref:PepSY domain-containing protein n=1 Tax=Veillonella sp. TaxID=1926307 RepID=UPI0025802CE7|nr:PepSY domain-containing protein [Veillonella sp.]